MGKGQLPESRHARTNQWERNGGSLRGLGFYSHAKYRLCQLGMGTKALGRRSTGGAEVASVD